MVLPDNLTEALMRREGIFDLAARAAILVIGLPLMTTVTYQLLNNVHQKSTPHEHRFVLAIVPEPATEELRTQPIEETSAESVVQEPTKIAPLIAKNDWERSVVKDGPSVIARWQGTVEAVLLMHGIDLPPELIMSIMLTESMGKPDSVNLETGATGLLGIKPVVCEQLRINPCDLLDPEQNILIGSRYLAWIREKEGFVDEILISAYGVGHSKVREHIKKYPKVPIGRAYVGRVLYALNAIAEMDPT